MIALSQPNRRVAPLLLAGLLAGLLAVLPAAGCQYLPGHKAEAAAPPPARILHLDSTVVNLADQDATSYLRIGVSIGLHAADSAGDATIQAVARDTVVSDAGARTAAELLGADGKTELKKAILSDLQKKLPQAQISAVYFDDFLVQR